MSDEINLLRHPVVPSHYGRYPQSEVDVFRIKTLGMITITTLVAGSVSACTEKKENGHSLKGEPAIALPQVEPDEADTKPLPIDTYSSTESERQTLLQANQIALRDCMKRKGFTYEISPPPPNPKNLSSVDMNNRGLVSASSAAKNGYHSPYKQPDPKSLMSLLPPDTDDYNIAMRGHADRKSTNRPLGGCMKEAEDRKRVPNETMANNELISQIREKSFEQTVEDSRVKATKQAWSQCMKKRGYNYDKPTDASAAAWPDPPGQKEIETAVTDMSCKKEVRLLGTWESVISAYQNILISKNEVALQGIREYIKARVERAKEIIQGRA